MTRSIRLIYRNLQGRVRRNFNGEGLTESSAVLITAAEWGRYARSLRFAAWPP